MPISDVDPRHAIDVDAQLQEELRSLFIVDTQYYLQRYNHIVQSLQGQSWQSDIQELYRCIHTIKGEAVTVSAEGVLRVATALENVLSDLRYLELAPPLQDGHLGQALLEAGELLTATVDLQQPGETDPILHYLQTLHAEIRDRYLPQWDETRQLHQDFAEQGFDLVVLDLEVALERLPDQGIVPDSTLQTAQQVLMHLQQIGQELQFASGWTDLLQRSQALFDHPEIAIWRSHWLHLFQAFKACARQSGNPIPFEFASFEVAQLADQQAVTLPSFSLPLPGDLPPLDADIADIADIAAIADPFPLASGHPNPVPDDYSQTATLTDVGAFLDDLSLLADDPVPPINSLTNSLPPGDFADLPDLGNFLGDYTPLAPPPLEPVIEFETGETDLDQSLEVDWLPDLDQVKSWLDQTDQGNFFAESLPSIREHDQETNFAIDSQPGLQPTAVPIERPVLRETPQPKPGQFTDKPKKVQVPVPLEKLDQSAQHLVETLLSLRTTRGVYQTLQTQITQLVALAQESAQYITHLRQIQDDYALLNQLQNSTPTAQGPTPERYRQGYTVINRLLETSLRLSEIGAETGKTSQQITDYLRDVDRNVLKLQTTIEDSRLVPFQNLGFRAKAILRDLTTRYSKPARLVVRGEQTELDVGTARALEPAILHLIRNAYDHGLEPVEQRIAQGKSKQGTITLSLQRRGNLFQLELRDDGRGLDAQSIQSRAKALGLPLTSTQTAAELLAVICQPGFSSQSQVTEVSGRGIGMDVVAAQMARLGGRLSLETTAGRETVFHLQIPVPRLLVPCVLLQTGNSVLAIPEDDIRTVMLFKNLSASPAEDSTNSYAWMVQDETGATPVFDLLNYWQPRAGDRPLADTAVCLSIRAEDAQEDIWFLADELLEQSELIINPLPTPLIAPDGLIGVSLQANGSLIPVLEARRLAERLLASPLQGFETAPVGPSVPDSWEEEFTQSILVVDDAALMRRRLEASLNAYGHPTHCCADGLEAWNWLQTHAYPSLMITDIEMPNMDGFTLIDRCRQAGITIPILVVSSRLSEDWFGEAKRLGATDYLTKGFSTVELIKKVSALLQDLRK
ncbi:MAG: response regulator [Leptolyngbyaceae cyanobacterium RU_5_1]|nr:response regulator [Leptolyngbyaceae cyanobacterium RU_5_1]